MKDFVKRTILKTLREFNLLEVMPTLEDVYYSLDTSEIKTAIKKAAFDEAFDELVRAEEVLVARVDDLFFVTLADANRNDPAAVLDNRKLYRKSIKKIAKKIELFKKFPFVLNISTLNLIPIKDNHSDQIYIFVKNGSKNIIATLIKLKFLFSRKWLKRVKIIEYKDVKTIFVERQIQSAYKLANLHPIINKANFYENLIYANKWVFEILGNFPVSRISLNYRGTSKPGNFEASFITKSLNKLFKLFV